MALSPGRTHLTLTLPTPLVERLRTMATARGTQPSVLLRAVIPTCLDRLDDSLADDHDLFNGFVSGEILAESERRVRAGKKGMASRWGTGKGEHRTGIDMLVPRARAVKNLATEYGTTVSVLVRAMIDHYLHLPDGEARSQTDAVLRAAATAEHNRRSAVAARGIHGQTVELEQAPDRRRVGLVLDPGQADAMKNRSGTSVAVSLRTLIGHDLDVIAGPDGPVRRCLVDALYRASAVDSVRRGAVGRKVVKERNKKKGEEDSHLR